MSTIAVFPGQGAQSVGMGRAFYDDVGQARAVFDEVDDALGEKLSKIIFEGPEDELTLTANTQPALMATSMAAVRAIEARTGKSFCEMIDFAAGHSLGEYSALAAVGALSITDAARLLRLRGQAMQDAVGVGEGAMAAILGLSIEDVEAVAAEAAKAGICDVANDNSDGQVVLSGAKAAVETACALAKDKGAKRAMLLQVSAPFHCQLMQPAAERLAQALSTTQFHPPAKPVLANVLAAPNQDPAQLADLLTRQVTGRVRWRESMTWMADNGVDRLIECGAGKVLSGLAKRALRGASLHNIQQTGDIGQLL